MSRTRLVIFSSSAFLSLIFYFDEQDHQTLSVWSQIPGHHPRFCLAPKSHSMTILDSTSWYLRNPYASSSPARPSFSSLASSALLLLFPDSSLWIQWCSFQIVLYIEAQLWKMQICFCQPLFTPPITLPTKTFQRHSIAQIHALWDLLCSLSWAPLCIYNSVCSI